MIDTETIRNINYLVTDFKGCLIDKNGVDSIIGSAMQTYDGEFLIPDEIDRCIKVYYHLATTQYFSDGNKRTAELSLKVNLEELGYNLIVKDTVLGNLTLKVANNQVSEEECNIEIRKYIH